MTYGELIEQLDMLLDNAAEAHAEQRDQDYYGASAPQTDRERQVAKERG